MKDTKINKSNLKLLNQLMLNVKDIKKFYGLDKELDLVIDALVEVTKENIDFLKNIYNDTKSKQFENIIKIIIKNSIETRSIIEEINEKIK